MAGKGGLVPKSAAVAEPASAASMAAVSMTRAEFWREVLYMNANPLSRFTPSSPHFGNLYADYLGESVTFRSHAKCIVSNITFCTESDVFLTHRLFEKGNAPAAGRHLVWQSGASRRDGLNCRQLCANVLDHIQQHFP